MWNNFSSLIAILGAILAVVLLKAHTMSSPSASNTNANSSIPKNYSIYTSLDQLNFNKEFPLPKTFNKIQPQIQPHNQTVSDVIPPINQLKVQSVGEVTPQVQQIRFTQVNPTFPGNN